MALPKCAVVHGSRLGHSNHGLSDAAIMIKQLKRLSDTAPIEATIAMSRPSPVLTQDLVSCEPLGGVQVAHAANEVLGIVRDRGPGVRAEVHLPAEHRLEDALLRL